MFYETMTLLSYWYYKCTNQPWFMVKFLAVMATLPFLLYGGRYVAWDTPFPVYVLDKLNLRTFSLPNLVCDNCNNFSYSYLLENKNACANQDVFLLTFVTSFHSNVEARNNMRKTWGSLKEYRGYKLKLLFVFGTHPDKNLNHQTFYEQNLYGDIIQGNFSDTYQTLTNKSSLALHWITKNCPQARYILKTDDDSFNVPQRIVDYLIHVKDDKFFGGYCFTVIPDRRVGSKFYVPESTYPEQYYPTYCAGPGYILSIGAAQDVIRVSNNVKYIQMEDVFITGMCRVVAGHQYTQISGMVISQDDMTPCDLAIWAKNAHNVVPRRAAMLWEKAVAADKERDCVSRNTMLYFVLLGFIICWGTILNRLFRHR